jgi:hypothetical protein
VACSSDISVSAPFAWRCLSASIVTPLPHPTHRTGGVGPAIPAVAITVGHRIAEATTVFPVVLVLGVTPRVRPRIMAGERPPPTPSRDGVRRKRSLREAYRRTSPTKLEDIITFTIPTPAEPAPAETQMIPLFLSNLCVGRTVFATLCETVGLILPPTRRRAKKGF